MGKLELSAYMNRLRGKNKTKKERNAEHDSTKTTEIEF